MSTIGSAEGVDALRVVAHHADVGVGLCQAAYDEILRVVGILVLIYEDVPEPVPVLFQRVGKVPEKDVGVYQQVVEIHGVVGLAPPGVFEEDGGEFGTLPGAEALKPLSSLSRSKTQPERSASTVPRIAKVNVN